jgi:protein-S-isoprenylcysteine O-methyltransferase Ste14
VTDTTRVMSSSFLQRVLSRALLSSLFTIISVVGVISAVRADSSAAVVHHALSAVLWGMFALLVVIRPVPLRRGGSRMGIAAAVGAQLVTLVLGAVAGDSTFSGTALWVADVLLAGGLIFAIASLAFLGRCFGILPDVRGLVTRGPYRFVRHPLYLGELTSLLGIALGADRWQLAVALWLVAVALQLVRTKYEERSLRAEFPEYSQYAERTKRLIPGVV